MSSELKNRILFTVFVLFLYRVGTFIPLPGIDANIIRQFFSTEIGSIFNVVNMFSGGAFARMSIFALNIMPYITSSIIIQLMTSVYKGLEDLKKEGEYGRQKINQYTKYLTVALGLVQSIGIYVAFSRLEQSAFISDSRIFLWTTMITLMSGTMALMWLGDRITSNGIGNGISMIIFVGIVAELPASLIKILNLSKQGVYSWVFVLFILALLVALILFITFVEKTLRNIKIQYPNRGLMKAHGGSDSSYIPLKVNMSGVIPPIFASSVMMFPVLLAQFFDGAASQKIAAVLSRGGLVYNLIFTVLIIFFCFFYSSIVFNTEDVADNLKRSNCFIPGIRPGKGTSDYLNWIVNRLTFIGAIYLSLVCIVPETVITRYGVPLSIGGTSLMIMVSVVIDLVTQVQSYMFSEKYSTVGKKRKVRVKYR